MIETLEFSRGEVEVRVRWYPDEAVVRRLDYGHCTGRDRVPATADGLDPDEVRRVARRMAEVVPG